MAIGSLLRDRDIQYVALKDDATNTWRILDTWNAALKEFDVEDDIPDDNEAVQIITEAAFIALIKEATRLGVLENASLGNNDVNDEDLLALERENQELQEKLSKIEENVVKYKEEPKKPQYSENYAIKDRAIQAIINLAGMADVEKISEDK
tara:strand:+ start:141 stop:593 length:453 start_codon:yes stop_codon:yes gene_type:complete